MLKQVWIARCDLCGKEEKAKAVRGRYNETEHTLPDGWECGHNKDFHLCGECAAIVNQSRSAKNDDSDTMPIFHENGRTYKGCLNSYRCKEWNANGSKAYSMDCEDWDAVFIDY